MGGEPLATRAFVLIETAVGKTKKVVSNIKQLQGVKSVDVVTGPYDAIAVVEAESVSEVGGLVITKMHLDGISRAVTCLAIP